MKKASREPSRSAMGALAGNGANCQGKWGGETRFLKVTTVAKVSKVVWGATIFRGEAKRRRTSGEIDDLKEPGHPLAGPAGWQAKSYVESSFSSTVLAGQRQLRWTVFPHVESQQLTQPFSHLPTAEGPLHDVEIGGPVRFHHD
jgi:hypothetical protein